MSNFDKIDNAPNGWHPYDDGHEGKMSRMHPVGYNESYEEAKKRADEWREKRRKEKESQKEKESKNESVARLDMNDLRRLVEGIVRKAVIKEASQYKRDVVGDIEMEDFDEDIPRRYRISPKKLFSLGVKECMKRVITMAYRDGYSREEAYSLANRSLARTQAIIDFSKDKELEYETGFDWRGRENRIPRKKVKPSAFELSPEIAGGREHPDVGWATDGGW